jgi:circadian clock protein KaiB
MQMDGAEALDLLLFVRGNGTRAMDAIRSVRKVCNATGGGPHSLQVIDVFNQPELVAKYRVIATPTLVTLGGLHERRLVGDMSEQNVIDHFESGGHVG